MTNHQGDGTMPHDSPLVNQVDLQASYERERELQKRYEDLFNFLNRHTRESHVRRRKGRERGREGGREGGRRMEGERERREKGEREGGREKRERVR